MPLQDWPVQRWTGQLTPWLPGFSAQVLPQIDSSNSELMRRARAGATQPALLVALAQTAGRGRLGRSWLSQPADALTFSLGLPLQMRDWSGLSLAVGLSVAQSLHPGIQLKWPNDLWWQQRKLAGILIETANVGAQRYAVIGVGINLKARDAQGLSTPPAWLQEALPGITGPQALESLLAPLVQTLRRFEHEGFGPFVDGFNARDGLRDREVRLSDGVCGVALGVNASGALLVHTAHGPQAIVSSEVSVRPVPAGA
jgi:BirA family biotin operon repressor/biotin-[acetyl-CoA-carboxylase] ligase